MAVILLDGTVVQYLYLVERKSFEGQWLTHAIDNVVNRYEKIYYEARSGQSHLEATLHSSPRFGSSLVALDEDMKPDTRSGEAQLLRNTLKYAERMPAILEAIQKYERLKQGSPRKREVLLGYTVRMLLLARHLEADLWVWEGRCEILHALFAEAGYPPQQVSDMADLYEAGPCVFPYLPRTTSAGWPHLYRFLAPNTKYVPIVSAADAAITQTQPMRPARIFISYSHIDEGFRDQLENHLAVMKRRGIIETWSDRVILASANWKGEIDSALERSDLILLLVSADFCASEYCWDIEMRRALDRHESGEARVVPISIRPCDWTEAPFALLQGLPRGLKPISQWSDRDAAWLDVVKGVSYLLSSQSRK